MQPTFEDLSEHVQQAHFHLLKKECRENEYVCNLCGKILSSASSLDRHTLVHSGERPYKCNHCSMSFTTNGNMNRHIRKSHRAASPSSITDSEASDDSGTSLRRSHHEEEYNNNEISKSLALNCSKRKILSYSKPEDEIRCKRNRSEEQDSESPRCYVCRVRCVNDAYLDEHIKKHHPRCKNCKRVFSDDCELQKHQYSCRKDAGESIRGFQDLTFIDFSTGKFPTIARSMCEEKLHRPPSREIAKYQCYKCNHAFPCQSALDAHERDCGLPVQRHPDEELSNTTEFFDGLHLQNKAALAEAKEGKDLADIPSIISVTSGSIFHNLARSDTSTPDICQKKNGQNAGSTCSSGTPSSDHHEEEMQDDFAHEFRKMKLKGEFPCKLCTMIFPNLRALKGHNRAHMNVGPNEPYPCNMCPYSSTDKQTLIKHLRSHNGDRPFECKECHFAFTTKANCERHVRNRHNKTDKREIQSLIHNHPIEETPVEVVEKPRDEAKKTPKIERNELLRQASQIHLAPQPHYLPSPIDAKPMLLAQESLKRTMQAGLYDMGMMNHFENSSLFMRSQYNQRAEPAFRGDELDQPQNLSVRTDSAKSEDGRDSASSGVNSPLVNEANPAHQRNEASPSSTSRDASLNDDVPLDLSMDVLDLSKKSSDKKTTNGSSETDNNNTSAKDTENNNSYLNINQLLYSQALLSGATSTNFQNLYNKEYMLRMHMTNSPMFHSYLLNQHFLNDYPLKDTIQPKELVRGLQTSGGSLVQSVMGNPAFPNSASMPIGSLTSMGSEHNFKPVSTSSQSVTPVNVQETVNSTSPSTANSVRMVLKNGHLMPKQKQRRYRTERPHVCHICTAKFTLRSNMDRHVKQQHPAVWKKRPRNARSNRGRPPSSPRKMNVRIRRPDTSMSQSYDGYYQDMDQSTDTENKHAISSQVKYAILAQQQKNCKSEPVESDEELVIDEEPNDKDSCESVATSDCGSMLKETLQAGEVKSEEVYDLSKRHDADNNNEDYDRFGNPLPGTSGTKTSLVVGKVAETREENCAVDLASVSDIVDNATQQYQQFQPHYMSEEEGLVASNSDGNNSSDDKSLPESVNSASSNQSDLSSKKKTMKKKKMMKKKSAYSTAPNRVNCPYCQRQFPWTSSLRRHILTHTGQKPFRCKHCGLLFTTKSNCDRHLIRKHPGNGIGAAETQETVNNAVNSSNGNNNNPSILNNNSAFAMRNVPERPYKCNYCPSSTFSTIGNLKKHQQSKHPHQRKSRLV